MNKEEIIQLFLEEAVERLGELSNQLLLLETEPDNKDSINNLFRVAHTVKGNASTAHNTIMDLDPDEVTLIHIDKIAKITHAMENLIMEARDNDLKLTPERIDVLFETEDALANLISYVQSNIEEEYDVELLHSKLFQLSSDSNEEVKETPKIETVKTTSEEVQEIEIKLNCDPDYKHAFLSLVYRDIEEKFENVKFNPDFDHLMTGEDFEHIYIYFPVKYGINDIVAFVEKIDNVSEVLFEGDKSSAKREVTESPVIETTKETVKETPKVATKPTAKPVETEQKHKPVVTQNFTNASIKVAINRIDEVLKDVSSLVILKNKLSSFSKNIDLKDVKILQDISEQISQTVDSLQDSVMKIRMTPLEQLFGRFPRDVRNIGKEFGKKVNFTYSGAETEIDKSLLDELFDPLMHLVRNSIFHGLEAESERKANGKDPVGNLSLSAKHEQGMVVITIEDDGKGINVEKVVKKAIEKGVITEERAKNAPRHELINLIFHQGLSTADTVNSVAGRGVGMDAVRAKIESMKGSVQVFSEDGKGTRTIISLPLTLAIIQAMLTKIGDDYFAFPLSSVDEVVTIKTDKIRSVANKEVYVLRGKELPILRLNQYFGISSPSDTAEDLDLVILKLGDKTIGATVDEHIGQEDIVVKNIGAYLGNVPGISGCNILGDGSISLIVDVNSLITRA
jgi:two-component system chemotaxis sensor kinase CheA